jgi:DNA-binding IclR family transcriptional regulator
MEQRPSSVTAKVLALLAAFTPDDPELTLSQLARRAGLTLPTAYRRVAELEEGGALERTSGGRYRVGLRLCEVASLAPRGLALRERALPFLEDLPTAHRQNVQLAVREGVELVFVERIAGRDAVPVLTRVGGRFSLHATGVGLVLLARLTVGPRRVVRDGPQVPGPQNLPCVTDYPRRRGRRVRPRPCARGARPRPRAGAAGRSRPRTGCRRAPRGRAG